MALSTIAAIRDRCHVLIEALTPALLTADKFRRYRNEDGADFVGDMEADPPASFRRFQIRSDGIDSAPAVSNVLEERVPVTMELRVAYPQTHRYGPDNALDRDDVIEQDWRAINYSIGIYGRANFSSTHDCTPLPAEKEIERGDGVDFLLVRLQYEYLRSIT